MWKFHNFVSTDYFPKYAEPIPGESTSALSDAAKKFGVFVVGGSVPEREGDKLYNTCTVWGPQGDMIAKHRKVSFIHLIVEKFKVCLHTWHLLNVLMHNLPVESEYLLQPILLPSVFSMTHTLVGGVVHSDLFFRFLVQQGKYNRMLSVVLWLFLLVTMQGCYKLLYAYLSWWQYNHYMNSIKQYLQLYHELFSCEILFPDSPLWH